MHASNTVKPFEWFPVRDELARLNAQIVVAELDLESYRQQRDELLASVQQRFVPADSLDQETADRLPAAVTFVERHFAASNGKQAKPAARAEQRKTSGNDPLATGNYDYDESFEGGRR